MSTEPNEWWRDHRNLVTLTAYMAESGAEASEVAHAVEYPWRYPDEFRAAQLHFEDH